MIELEVRPSDSAAKDPVLRIERKWLRSQTPSIHFERPLISDEVRLAPELFELALRQPIVL